MPAFARHFNVNCGAPSRNSPNKTSKLPPWQTRSVKAVEQLPITWRRAVNGAVLPSL
jgi:hypothetical protein